MLNSIEVSHKEFVQKSENEIKKLLFSMTQESKVDESKKEEIDQQQFKSTLMQTDVANDRNSDAGRRFSFGDRDNDNTDETFSKKPPRKSIDDCIGFNFGVMQVNEHEKTKRKDRADISDDDKHKRLSYS